MRYGCLEDLQRCMLAEMFWRIKEMPPVLQKTSKIKWFQSAKDHCFDVPVVQLKCALCMNYFYFSEHLGAASNSVATVTTHIASPTSILRFCI